MTMDRIVGIDFQITVNVHNIRVTRPRARNDIIHSNVYKFNATEDVSSCVGVVIQFLYVVLPLGGGGGVRSDCSCSRRHFL